MSEKELLQFKYKNYAPPGGVWFYTVPETNQYIESRSSLRDLVSKVTLHYVTNNKETPSNISAIIEDHMCRNISGNFCNGQENNNGLDFFSVMQVSELLFRRMLGTDMYVSQRQADERARTCVSCKFNLKHMCTSCNGLREVFRKLVANRKTPYDTALGICSACGCGLSAKVHISRKYLADNPKKREEYPDHCWMVKEREG